MRLLNVHTYEFTHFRSRQATPPYIVASHRWVQATETSYQDVQKQRNTGSQGYRKLDGFVAYIKQHIPQLQWLWMDTCCINQRDAAELSEAVNSMFNWYQNAEICLAYLADVADLTSEDDFRHSEWFLRGWTLQELIAPQTVLFLSQDWRVIGYKGRNKIDKLGRALEVAIAATTGIPEALLYNPNCLRRFTSDEILKWIVGRTTTREEDIWYCLFGILDVALGANYGEGAHRARRRLMTELGERRLATPPQNASYESPGTHANEQSNSSQLRGRATRSYQRSRTGAASPMPVSHSPDPEIGASPAMDERVSAPLSPSDRRSFTRPVSTDAVASASFESGSIRQDYRTHDTQDLFVPTDSNEQKLLRLNHEMSRAKEKTTSPSTVGLFQKAVSTDLLLLIDTSASMEAYLNVVKVQIRSIVNDIQSAMLTECQVRVAIVPYTHERDNMTSKWLDFTTSMDMLYSFLHTMTTRPIANDAKPDVLGGIKQALKLSWSSQNRSLVHVADKPPHVSELNDLHELTIRDNPPNALAYRALLTGLTQLNINYAFLRINSSTDKMTHAFSKVYGRGNAKLHPENTYYHEVECGDRASLDCSGSSSFQPHFEELQLDTAHISHPTTGYTVDVTSIARAAGRISVTIRHGSRTRETALTLVLGGGSQEQTSYSDASDDCDNRYGTQFVRGGSHYVVSDNPEPSRNVELVSVPVVNGVASQKCRHKSEVESECVKPQWTTPGWLDERMEVEGFSPAAVVHQASTLGDMMDSDESIKLSVAEFTLFARSKPFAQGAVRKASYARTSASANRFVVKSFLKDGPGRPEVAEDMRMQALCKAFALEFNGLLKIEPPLDFIVSSCLEIKGKSRTATRPDCLSLEPYIDGEYVKYNSNAGYVNEDLASDPFNQMAQAFSHFTFERSRGLFLVDDLQGVGHLLTDPAVQTKDPERFKLNDTNMGVEGFKFFFATHRCNSYCKKLELISSAKMFGTDKWKFRPKWPTMKPTVCCSNKLCRSIIHEKHAHKSGHFPGHNWCDGCWSQLQVPPTPWKCVKPGCNHHFEISTFHLESQGLPTRIECPSHRAKDREEKRGDVVGKRAVGENDI